MDISRRNLLNASAASAAAGALIGASDPARAATLMSALGRDATQYGVRPNAPEDQTKKASEKVSELLKQYEAKAESSLKDKTDDIMKF